uniref:Ring finger and CHY zinc finger domain containing 1 n=1 Tax=Paramormyrops kingsleyae TaxID=1676925 RepID=A0A3B3T4K0_9TELE
MQQRTNVQSKPDRQVVEGECRSDVFLCDTNSANMSACECGCEHYVRSCLLKAPCCGKFYVCRLCHDDVEDHQMDRFRVTEVKCSLCDTVQQSQQMCEKCRVAFGEYYCSICHLFDKDKKQYHCLPCGICRIGPKENYFHCEKCNLCLASNLRGNHKCVPDVSRQNCPVCLEDIHTSRTGAHVLPCGHLLHQTCFDYMHKMGGYRCPLCMHSAWNMKHCWEEMDKQISETPMPSEYQGITVKVYWARGGRGTGKPDDDDVG